MNTRRFAGRDVRRWFGAKARLSALDDFYRSYNKGEYYRMFKEEAEYLLKRGLFR